MHIVLSKSYLPFSFSLSPNSQRSAKMTINTKAHRQNGIQTNTQLYSNSITESITIFQNTEIRHSSYQIQIESIDTTIERISLWKQLKWHACSDTAGQLNKHCGQFIMKMTAVQTDCLEGFLRGDATAHARQTDGHMCRMPKWKLA